ncbi:MAG TPA: hypothetical protein VJP40_08065 [bacterium]|nr:hypothetical protein [bacterium]
MSLRRFAILSLAVLLPLTVHAKPFAPAGAGFSVNMPGKPRHSETTHKSFVGAVQENSYTVNGGGATYTASVSDLPGVAVALGGAGTILGKAKDGLLKESGGSETSFEKTSLGGNEGRVLTYSLPSGGSGKAQLYLVDKRLYVIVGAGPKSAAPAIDRFINSFKLQ